MLIALRASRVNLHDQPRSQDSLLFEGHTGEHPGARLLQDCPKIAKIVSIPLKRI